jgi:hypothetical protein
LSRAEKIQYRVATIGAAATFLAATVTPATQLIDERGSAADSPISCAAAVEKVVEEIEEHPALAHAYDDGAGEMPDLFNEEEEEACGDPQRLEEEVADDVGDYPGPGRAISRR